MRSLITLMTITLQFLSCIRQESVKTPSGNRPYQLNVPEQIKPGQAYPLVILLHGHGGYGPKTSSYFGFDKLVDSKGFILAMPEGTRRWFLGKRYFNATDLCCAFVQNPPDDVTYIDAVIDDVSAKYMIDEKRIFVAGHSNGGYMAYRYACDRAERVAAIISLAGAMWTDTSRCDPEEPVAVLQIHGDADTIVPYESVDNYQGSSTTHISAHETAAAWAGFNGCKATSETNEQALDLIADEDPPLGKETTLEKWGSCRGAELWTLQGGSHKPRLNQPIWAESLYAWLMAHPKP